MLEKQQQIILIQEQKHKQILKCILYSIAIYMIFFAIYFIGHFHFWYWVANPSIFFAGFLIATAIIIFEGVIKLMNKDILITKEMLLVWNVKNVEQQNIAKMDL